MVQQNLSSHDKKPDELVTNTSENLALFICIIITGYLLLLPFGSLFGSASAIGTRFVPDVRYPLLPQKRNARRARAELELDSLEIYRGELIQFQMYFCSLVDIVGPKLSHGRKQRAPQEKERHDSRNMTNEVTAGDIDNQLRLSVSIAAVCNAQASKGPPKFVFYHSYPDLQPLS